MAISQEPQNISKTDWYYEHQSHLLLVHEVRDKDGSLLQTDQIKLPWRTIERSRKRRARRNAPPPDSDGKAGDQGE